MDLIRYDYMRHDTRPIKTCVLFEEYSQCETSAILVFSLRQWDLSMKAARRSSTN